MSESQQSSSTRKRKTITDEIGVSITSSGQSAFSQATKRKVAILDGTRCWNCGASPAQTCHVYEKKDSSFEEAVRVGAITLTHLGHEDNAIPLCPLCHHNFDNINDPGWIFLPTDLEYFIEREEKNFSARERVMRETEEFEPRLCPTATQYRNHQKQNNIIPDNAVGGLYQRYMIRNFYSHEFLVHMGAPENWDYWVPGKGPLPPKTWHGAPTATVHRALAIIGRLFWVRHLPEEFRLLRRLQELYSRELEVNNTEIVPGAGGDGDNSSGQGQGQGQNTSGRQEINLNLPAQPPNQAESMQPPPLRGQARYNAADSETAGGATDSAIDVSSGTSKRKSTLDSSTTPSIPPPKRRIIMSDTSPHEVPSSPQSIPSSVVSQPPSQAHTSGHLDSRSERNRFPPWRWGPRSTSSTKAWLYSATFGPEPESHMKSG